MRDDRQRDAGREGHGGFGVEQPVGRQHHGLDLQLCGAIKTQTKLFPRKNSGE